MGCDCGCHAKLDAIGISGCCFGCEDRHDNLSWARSFHLDVLGALAKARVPTPESGYLKPPFANVAADIADLASGKYGRKPAYICIDCDWHHQHLEPLPGLTCRPGGPGHEGKLPDGFVCAHFTPQYWEQQGFNRNWGDAAVMNDPNFEILRKEDDNEVLYKILAPAALRRPVTLFAKKKGGLPGKGPAYESGSQFSWGGY